jgi:hypothetical protein
MGTRSAGAKSVMGMVPCMEPLLVVCILFSNRSNHPLLAETGKRLTRRNREFNGQPSTKIELRRAAPYSPAPEWL